MNKEEKRRRKTTLAKHSKQRQISRRKRRFIFRTLKAKEEAGEVEETVVVAEVEADRKERENIPTTKIGAEEDAVHGEEVG